MADNCIMDSRAPLTLANLAAHVAQASGLDASRVTTALQSLFETATERLTATGRAELPGIGIFVKEGEDVTFVPDGPFAEAVNEPFAMFEPLELADDADIAIATANTSENSEGYDHSMNSESAESALRAESGEDYSEDTGADEKSEGSEKSEEAEKSEAVEKSEDYESTEMPEVSEPQPTPEAADAPAEPARIPAAVTAPLPAHRFYRLGWLAVGVVIGLIIGFLTGALIYKQPSSPAIAQVSDIKTPDAEIVSEPESSPEQSLTEASATQASEAEGASAPQAHPAIMRTDTVTVRRYITHMAKDYYGDRIFWVYIYEANTDILGHPERTLPGTVVKIPTPESIPADPSNPADVKRARALAAEIYSRFQ